MTDGLKRCAKCGQQRTLDEFHRHSGFRDGRRSVCKECRKLEKADRSGEVAKPRTNAPPSSGDSRAATGMATWAVVLVSCVVLGAAVPEARAWSNGTEGCNSYGTHDWVLDQALQAVGEQADWVRTRVALRATDDPDCKDGIDHASGTWWHVYDRWGEEWGGADEATAVWFRRVKSRLANGNERGASRALGIMSHFIADVANPMHTDSSEREDSVHSSYESAVDRRIFDEYNFNYNDEDRAKPGPKTRSVARRAHPYYWDLVRAYDTHGYSSKVHRITKRQLKRGANALADLITSLR